MNFNTTTVQNIIYTFFEQIHGNYLKVYSNILGNSSAAFIDYFEMFRRQEIYKLSVRKLN